MSESAARISSAPAARPVLPRELDALLEEAQDHLQLQMLLIEVAASNDQADFELIVRAYHFARVCHRGQVRKSGEPFLRHCVEVARILAQLRLDAPTISAGLLHDVLEDTETTYEQIASRFGVKIAALIDGVTKIERFPYQSRAARQAETYRKMMLSMVEDIRVILIKFADRLHNMRTLEYVDSTQQERIARETLEVYAPLAHRLGLARIRSQLEDGSLKFLDPESYREIRDKVDMKHREREAYIEEFKAPIEEELHHNGLEAEISGRAKHFYSIYHKMESSGKSFDEIYDLLALRIIVHSVRECYHVLGLVHTIYHPIPDRFKDYIATPKSNMYQSLHTSVVGPGGRTVEIQIRTWEMHYTAEIGIAAHWRYKSGARAPSDLDQHIHWLRQILDWQREATDPLEFMENLKIELFQDEIFVFTPRGDLLQFPKGATPIDFAFAIHTDIGLHCLTAKVNDQIVPLSAELHSGDKVEIATSSQQKPRPSWLEWIKTTKARQSIRRWLKEEQHTHSVRLGQEIIERALKRHHCQVRREELDALAAEFNLPDGEHLCAAVGRGDLSVGRVINRLAPQPPRRHTQVPVQDRRGIRIQDIHDLMLHFGKCCNPLPGDRIIGLITRGRGISVHRADCPNLAAMDEDPERLLEVEWDLSADQAFAVQLKVTSNNRKYLLSDITRIISDTGVNILGSSTSAESNVAVESFCIEVRDVRQLQTLMQSLRRVEGVIAVERVDLPAASQPLAQK